jgi:glycolate oxidase FAD binding subunit
VRAARDAREPLRIRAGGSKDFYGNTPRGQILDPRPWSGIEAYEPSELVVTVRAGTPLAQLERTLAEQGQMLAFEPPHFGAGATVGGCVAAGLAGPRRASVGYTQGGLRDFVLGARLLDGNARLLRFGGTVMKNVAGYDVSRVLAGSLGLLGLIVDVSLKVLPLPRAEQTLCFALHADDALEQLCAWRSRPLPLSASAWCDGVLSVRLSGAEPALAAARRQLGGELVPAQMADAYWLQLREQQLSWFAGELPLWRIALPAAAGQLPLGSTQLIEWGGMLRWLRSAAPSQQIRDAAARLGGHATLFRGGDRSQGVFAPLSPALLGIHRRLKEEFDPAGIFNPDRLVQGL